jgi:quercetin dioxygenase-like cupin family protein
MNKIKTSSGAILLRPAKLSSYDRGGGTRTTPLISPRIGAGSFISGITEFAPGAAIPFHSHNCEESVVLLEGDAVMDIDEQEHELQALDTTFIPANVVHRFRNASKISPMKILWIYASPQATRTLAATGETHPVSDEHKRN